MSSRVLIRTTIRRHAREDHRIGDARQRPRVRRDGNRSEAAPLFTVNVEDVLADLGGGS